MANECNCTEDAETCLCVCNAGEHYHCKRAACTIYYRDDGTVVTTCPHYHPSHQHVTPAPGDEEELLSDD